jgi:hypothetical protein
MNNDLVDIFGVGQNSVSFLNVLFFLLSKPE